MTEVSQLPEFAVKLFHIDEPAGSYDMLEVRCPRKGCEAPEFWVRPNWVIIRPVSGRAEDPPAYPVGRPCPSCGKVSAVPASLRERRPEPEPAPAKAPRIVRRRSK